MPGRNFLYITFADLIVRSAYQMGKTPLLPIFAAMLGAGDLLLGLIVSVSTVTGMLLKPIFGMLSDRGGRRRWLLVGTAFFSLVPFCYWLIDTPQQLVAIRLFHGIATAIYGPVTLAYVAEHAPQKRAERIGIFGMARSAGYVVGPALAGWLLLSWSPPMVFTLIGLASCLAFLPILRLEETPTVMSTNRPPLLLQARNALADAGRTSAVWLSGGLEAANYVALYAMKAFLPVHALQQGHSTVIVGLFFAVQEAVNMTLKPFGGRFGDKRGYRLTIVSSMALLGVALILVGRFEGAGSMLALGAVIGALQAFIFPATTALVATRVSGQNLGAGLGVIGTLRNGGKVLGPILGGFLLRSLDFQQTFLLLGGALILGSMLVSWWLRPRKPGVDQLLASSRQSP